MPSDFDGVLSNAEIFRVAGDFEFLPEPEPRDVWCPVISADDHLFETPTIFDRVPAEHRDLAPTYIYVDGRPAWCRW